jgi:hypothetical protein
MKISEKEKNIQKTLSESQIKSYLKHIMGVPSIFIFHSNFTYHNVMENTMFAVEFK